MLGLLPRADVDNALGRNHEVLIAFVLVSNGPGVTGICRLDGWSKEEEHETKRQFGPNSSASHTSTPKESECMCI